jgi:hypothetical protein
MTYPATGTCQCGAVHYVVKQAPIVTVVCHCTDCQKISAGAFTITMLVKREDFELVRGKLGVFDRPAESGNIARCYFCPTCSNRIYHEDPEKPEVIRVKPGTFDDTSIIQPQMHVWTRNAQAWVKLPDDMPCYEMQPDRAVLFEQSR